LKGQGEREKVKEIEMFFSKNRKEKVKEERRRDVSFCFERK
jgi:hypothetical protein